MGTDRIPNELSGGDKQLLAVMRGNVPTVWIVLAHAVLDEEQHLQHRLLAGIELAKKIIEANDE